MAFISSAVDGAVVRAVNTYQLQFAAAGGAGLRMYTIQAVRPKSRSLTHKTAVKITIIDVDIRFES